MSTSTISNQNKSQALFFKKILVSNSIFYVIFHVEKILKAFSCNYVVNIPKTNLKSGNIRCFSWRFGDFEPKLEKTKQKQIIVFLKKSSDLFLQNKKIIVI